MEERPKLWDCGVICSTSTLTRSCSVCLGSDVFEELLPSLISRRSMSSAIDGVAPIFKVIYNCFGSREVVQLFVPFSGIDPIRFRDS
jgi:hypothetical protein